MNGLETIVLALLILLNIFSMSFVFVLCFYGLYKLREIKERNLNNKIITDTSNSIYQHFPFETN